MKMTVHAKPFKLKWLGKTGKLQANFTHIADKKNVLTKK
jgi:hypothetical protein